MSPGMSARRPLRSPCVEPPPAELQLPGRRSAPICLSAWSWRTPRNRLFVYAFTRCVVAIPREHLPHIYLKHNASPGYSPPAEMTLELSKPADIRSIQKTFNCIIELRNDIISSPNAAIELSKSDPEVQLSFKCADKGDHSAPSATTHCLCVRPIPTG